MVGFRRRGRIIPATGIVEDLKEREKKRKRKRKRKSREERRKKKGE